ncbi:glutamate--cysteine ligase [Virgisporangium aliadipatigenens]|uniref:Glutamate--cysteine ligase n=1 Tax=Virgisporangium aliadipatigenens TaxID=741659 RepID=A0A8J3YHT2_9ACTN|nr:glutamate--cysteine ligase [Virgisporangium aliadipatigenens]GIJ44463.1 glutamate--cysteine ligase [Virgisporangium aliadipatigenens]
MGQDVERREFSRADRMRYREKVRTNLDALTRMLEEVQFECERPLTGLEIELNLVDEDAAPAMRNQAVLDAIADPDFVTELGQWNIEINVPPDVLEGDGLHRFEQRVRGSLNAAEAKAAAIGTHTVMIGILPTLRQDHLTHDSLSANPRYALLNEQIFAARGEDMLIQIEGTEGLATRCDSIAPEAACTSAQLHLQVTPANFPTYWNAAQCIAGVQLALGANAPYLFGRELWRETRIPLFEQATDTRAEELKAQGVRPRVWFGERWITSIFDLFEENVRYFPALLPICEDEDPIAVLADGGVPKLGELTLHNGTIYRWNRPVYAVVKGRPHLRVENRVLPAGPTVVDIMANAAFYFGLVRTLAEADRPVWTRMSFNAAEENFHAGAKNGIDAQLFWPGFGHISAAELVLRHLLPMAHQGLDRSGVDPAHRDRLLGVIERRCVTLANGATWQVGSAARHHGRLAGMLREYRELMHANQPVHEWPS